MTIPLHDTFPRHESPKDDAKPGRRIEHPRQPEIIHTKNYDEFVAAKGKVAPGQELPTMKVVSPAQAEGKIVFVELGPLSLVEQESRCNIERTPEMVDFFLNAKRDLGRYLYGVRIPGSPSIIINQAFNEIIGLREVSFNEDGRIVRNERLPEELEGWTLDSIRKDENFRIVGEQKNFKSRAPLPRHDGSSQADVVHETETRVTMVRRGGTIKDKYFDKLLADIAQGFGVIEQYINRYQSDEDFRKRVSNRMPGTLSDESIDGIKSIILSVAGFVPSKQEVTDKFMLVDKRFNKQEVEPGPNIDIEIDYRLLTQKERDGLPEALRNLPKLILEKGSLYAIVGTNGSGKSTLVRAIQNAMLYLEGSGHSHRSIGVNLEDREGGVQNSASFDLARCIDVSGFGNSRSSNPPCIFLDCARCMTNYLQRSNRGDSVISKLMAEQKVYSVSTGQAQEEYFAEAIKRYQLQDYQGLVIIDEPEKGLDPWKLRALKDKMRNLAPQATIIIVTHNPMMVFDRSIKRIDLRFPELGVHTDEEESIF
ncbi:MAG: ABC-type transport system, ATPase component [uncultured bacterium]|uniref:ABC transporter related protein n=1 Tax=Candidatus Uhrbacteria bacterium GW2011_GWC1_41_20 TaxID=1618983 RepID=A0A0G0YEX5_9BACT|nr:MAG: ABC-type transport system, ATPase component [uncultured bacterium]KKR22953.1 MAG: ABC transporter related protein [Candidatus Uhrbacteria bacterium GW2011_GWE1_39_46]KKR63802.1 MAG: ABC transporter related protein [Candidatus Uhrbacteria bacterium GW2011_GWC2_40_450]KKR89894.1 MAG: ABC transporter related protein [Candidatus Uhrbacteria bacterium GW2011_GWD2_41_121]KKR95764.1 MAG: ABC transporter related protein [Candidatus Uhrbacteria bacterium GW2011_GWD1_41_16]KKR98892.1 MAG: ABC tr